MSKHKARLRHIRTIRAAQAREAEMTHTWLRDIATDEDVETLALEIETANLPALRDLDVPDQERERLRRERVAIRDRAIEVRSRLMLWIVSQE